MHNLGFSGRFDAKKPDLKPILLLSLMTLYSKKYIWYPMSNSMARVQKLLSFQICTDSSRSRLWKFFLGYLECGEEFRFRPQFWLVR